MNTRENGKTVKSLKRVRTLLSKIQKNALMSGVETPPWENSVRDFADMAVACMEELDRFQNAQEASLTTVILQVCHVMQKSVEMDQSLCEKMAKSKSASDRQSLRIISSRNNRIMRECIASLRSLRSLSRRRVSFVDSVIAGTALDDSEASEWAETGPDFSAEYVHPPLFSEG